MEAGGAKCLIHSDAKESILCFSVLEGQICV